MNKLKVRVLIGIGSAVISFGTADAQSIYSIAREEAQKPEPQKAALKAEANEDIANFLPALVTDGDGILPKVALHYGKSFDYIIEGNWSVSLAAQATENDGDESAAQSVDLFRLKGGTVDAEALLSAAGEILSEQVGCRFEAGGTLSWVHHGGSAGNAGQADGSEGETEGAAIDSSDDAVLSGKASLALTFLNNKIILGWEAAYSDALTDGDPEFNELLDSEIAQKATLTINPGSDYFAQLVYLPDSEVGEDLSLLVGRNF